jgi:glycosyltransferase involved in cell wall biosynthesis
MRIAFIGLRAIGCCSGGVETHVGELAPRMAALGHEVTVFCRAAYNTRESAVVDGVRLVNRPSCNTKHLEAISHTAACLPSVLTGFDIVHFHATGPSLLSWVPRLTGRRVVVTVHGLDYQRAKWGGIASLVLKAGAWTSARCPQATIVVSAKLKAHYRERYGRETFHIPNGVSRPVSRPLDGLARFGLVPGGYVLSLGRLVPEKGAHHLIEAFRLLDTDLKLVVAGGSSHSDGYESHLRGLAGEDPRIVFTGPLYGPDKDEAFSNARLFVMPSELEGMPIVLLEAMSHGCPVLTSDIEECVEVFPDGTCRDPRAGGIGPDTLALSHPVAEVASLAENLGRALEDPGLAAMGLRARDMTLATYDWDRITTATLGVYAQGR